jgi:hypothetical protein
MVVSVSSNLTCPTARFRGSGTYLSIVSVKHSPFAELMMRRAVGVSGVELGIIGDAEIARLSVVELVS